MLLLITTISELHPSHAIVINTTATSYASVQVRTHALAICIQESERVILVRYVLGAPLSQPYFPILSSDLMSISGHSYAPDSSTLIVHTEYDEVFDFSILDTFKSPWASIPGDVDAILTHRLSPNSPGLRIEEDGSRRIDETKGVQRGLQTLWISGLVTTVHATSPSAKHCGS